MADITTASQAWQQLQDLVRAEAESATVPSQQPHLLWIQSGRLALIGTWQVEASFAERAGAYRQPWRKRDKVDSTITVETNKLVMRRFLEFHQHCQREACPGTHLARRDILCSGTPRAAARSGWLPHRHRDDARGLP